MVNGNENKARPDEATDTVMIAEETNVSKPMPSADAEKGKIKRERLSVDPRALKSLNPGDSEIEELASKIEKQRDKRIPVTYNVRVQFLQTCREIAEYEDCPNFTIPETCLLTMQGDVQAKIDARREADSNFRKFLHYLGFLDETATMLEVLNRGVERVDDTDDDFFHYQDFSFYNTCLVSRWPWMRRPTFVSAMIMLLFYIFTPVWFCHIVPDRDVCPDDTGRSYGGWLTALYFASTTMSTVGYGDITVDKDTRGSVFVGIVYMIISLLVAVTAFSAAAENAFSGFGDLNEKILSFFTRNLLGGSLLHEEMRRIKIVKLADILFQFTLLNVIGMVIAHFFVRNYDSTTDWTWMTTFYWAVQTTTTVGYGDLDMPFSLRWFQVLYLTIGTYFVGNALGKLASLRQELEDTRRLYAWKRRVVSKGLIMDMNANDDILDQYEFLVSSLLSLGKISSDDVRPIMDRFRTLAGEKGYIQLSDQLEEDAFELNEDPDGCKLKHEPSST